MRTSPPLQLEILGLLLSVQAMTGCTISTPLAYDGGPCVWNFPSDDPCAASGLVCRFGPGGPAAGGANCILPGELFRCSPQLGCDDTSLACIEVPLPGLGNVPLCLRQCATAGNSADCPNPFSFCQPLPDGGLNACQPAGCIGAYQLASCKVGSSPPGTCVSLALGNTLLAFCQAAGTGGLGAGCSLQGDYGPLCAQGMACVSQQCFQLCNRSTGPACPTGTVCSPPYLVYESAAFFEGVDSLCLTPCSSDAGVGCPAPLNCYEAPGTPGYCLP